MKLVKWDKAKSAIAMATSVDEVKDIRDKAEAMRMYAKQAGETLEVQNQIAEIKIRAERKAGELIKEMPKAKNQNSATNTLLEAGISHIQSSRWQTVAEIPEVEFEEHIKSVNEKKEELTTSGTIRVAQKLRRNNIQINETDELTGKYRIIYADPPWQYRNKGLDNYGHAERHYPTMSTDDICEMEVNNITETDSVLFLWVTSPMLEDGIRVLNAWGFQYKTSMVWDKQRMNYGYYVGVQHEFILISTKGKCTPDNKDKLEPSVVSLKRSNVHSEKPEYFRELIDRLYPNGNRIELFARKKTKGWEVYGNQL